MLNLILIAANATADLGISGDNEWRSKGLGTTPTRHQTEKLTGEQLFLAGNVAGAGGNFNRKWLILRQCFSSG